MNAQLQKALAALDTLSEWAGQAVDDETAVVRSALESALREVKPKIVNAAIPLHALQMERLAEFCGATEIRYKDLGNGEGYLLIKDGRSLELLVRGNRVDGAFLCVQPIVELPK